MAMVERPLLGTAERVQAFDVTRWVLRISAGLLFLGVGLAHSSRTRTGCGSLPTSDLGTRFAI